MTASIHGRLFVAGAISVLALCSLAGAPYAVAADGTKLVEFVRPTSDTLIQRGTGPIRFIVRTRDGARPTEADVDGVDVTRLLKRGPNGRYGAILDLDRHLHYGVNDAFVVARGRDGTEATDHVHFIAAKRDDGLLKLTSFRTDTTAAPLRVAVSESTETHVRATLNVADGVSSRVYINGRRVDRAFSQERGRLVVQLGADDGLRFGRNHVQILVHRTHPRRRQSSYDLEERTVTIRRDAPIAGAGRDRTIDQGSVTQFDARATKLPPGWGRPSFRWTITSAPRGSKARLRNAAASRPALVPDRPGRYQVRVSVGGRGAAASAGVASAAQAAGPEGASNDTATLTVSRDVPPSGVAVSTADGYVAVAGVRLPGTGKSGANLNYAVLDRQTLEVAASGSVPADADGVAKVDGIVDSYTGSLDYLVVLSSRAEDVGSRDGYDTALRDLLRRIGAPAPTGARPLALDPDLSMVGVAGGPAGSAVVKGGSLSGAVRLNGAIAKFDFVFTDSVEFDTAAPGEQLTTRVGGQTFTQPNPGGGVSGFHLVTLDADTLGGQADRVYATNAADGSPRPDDVAAMADELTARAQDPERPLVILQAFGTPHGNDAAWDRAAKQIETLGGTRQVVNAMNTAAPQALNGESADRQGSYAFVGRAGATTPLAEASQSQNGRPGRLRGILMRVRDGGFEPTLAGPPTADGQSPVNGELMTVANQAQEDFPAFTDASGNAVEPGRAQAVQNFLGGPDVTGLCSAGLAACDVRKSYYRSYDANWASIQGDLANANCSQPGKGFSADECEGIRSQIRDEVSKVAKVTEYFGPSGLQRPFGASGVSALADVGEISQQIKDAVQPPAADNTTSSVLTGISYLTQAGYATPATTPAAAVLGAAFSLGGYFTKSDGSPNVIGPQVTTASSRLGVELADRYRQAGDNLDDLGRLIVSDYGKLTTVGTKVNAEPAAGEADWRLGNIAATQAAARQSTRRLIYERLVPLAYPVMHDLGAIGNARTWYCRTGPFESDRHLFADQTDGAQFVGRYGGYAPIVAVARENAAGSGGDARISGPPASVTDGLFKPTDQGGLGLSKGEFFSPRNGFRYLPNEPFPAPATKPRRFDDPTPSLHMFSDQIEERVKRPVLCRGLPTPPGASG